MNRVLPVALVIALLLPAAALAGARYRCLYTGVTSDHCEAAAASADQSSDGPVAGQVCCETLVSPFVVAPARVESGSMVVVAMADLPAAPATHARPRPVVRPDLVARAGPASGRPPTFLLHCSLQI